MAECGSTMAPPVSLFTAGDLASQARPVLAGALAGAGRLELAGWS